MFVSKAGAYLGAALFSQTVWQWWNKLRLFQQPRLWSFRPVNVLVSPSCRHYESVICHVDVRVQPHVGKWLASL